MLTHLPTRQMMISVRSNKLPITLFFLLSLLVLAPQQADAEKRIALVIGNAEYRDSPLSNPVNDALDITEALKKTGFEVDLHTNVDRKKMREAIRKFGDNLRQADIGLFYFAGHGIQIKGRNYLIPLAVDVQSADEVQDESIDTSAVLRKMESAGNAVNIVILDACRNNPFARSFRSMDRGLARMDGPVGSFIAYATAPGSVAADGTGRNGVYTEHLLEALNQPGLSIEQTFKRVRNGVKNITDGQQIPWESSSLMGEFVFLPTKKGTATLTSQTPPPPAPTLPSFKHLQVIANAPNASVTINNISRGITNEQGALNISNLTDNEVEVMVQAKGYAPQRQRIRLKDGQWEQLFITLETEKTASPPPKITNIIKTQDNNFSCSVGKRALLSSKMIIHRNGKKKIKRNMPAIQATIMQSFNRYGIDFINEDLILGDIKRKKMQKNQLKALAVKHKLQYFLRATVNVRELPVKLIRTNMKTVNAEITLELLDLKINRILASASQSFNKAGLDPKRVTQIQLKRLLPEMNKDLLTQACEKR